MQASLLSSVSAVNCLRRKKGERAASESSDSLGASPGPSSALCPPQVSNIQRESHANRQTDRKYVRQRRKKSLSEGAPEPGQR